MKIFLPSVLVAALSAGAVFATSPRDLQEPLMHDDYHHPHVTYTITKTKCVVQGILRQKLVTDLAFLTHVLSLFLGLLRPLL